jgi:hypothetical protein
MCAEKARDTTMLLFSKQVTDATYSLFNHVFKHRAGVWGRVILYYVNLNSRELAKGRALSSRESALLSQPHHITQREVAAKTLVLATR